MSIVTSELKHRESANMPSDDSSTVGGAKTVTDVGGSIGAIFHTRVANPEEIDATKYQYKKTFITNTNADTDLTGAKVYLANALDDVAVNGVVSATSDSADDDTSVKIKVVGENAAATVISEEIVLNGLSEVNGASTFSKIFFIELRTVAGNALINAVGNILIEVNGTEIGFIPSPSGSEGGYNCALSDVKIGIVATLNDSGTATNAVTAPGGISFTKPRTLATGLDVANGGILTFGSGQGVWWKQTVEGGELPSPNLTLGIRINGATA